MIFLNRENARVNSVGVRVEGLGEDCSSRRVTDTPPQSTVLDWWEEAEGLRRSDMSTSKPCRIWLRSDGATGIGLWARAEGGTGAGGAEEREKAEDWAVGGMA